MVRCILLTKYRQVKYIIFENKIHSKNKRQKGGYIATWTARFDQIIIVRGLTQKFRNKELKGKYLRIRRFLGRVRNSLQSFPAPCGYGSKVLISLLHKQWLQQCGNKEWNQTHVSPDERTLPTPTTGEQSEHQGNGTLHQQVFVVLQIIRYRLTTILSSPM